MITILMRFQKSYNLLFWASCFKRYSNLKLDSFFGTPCMAVKGKQAWGRLRLRLTKFDNHIKARSHDPILRTRFLVLKIGSRRSDGSISRFRFCV